MIANRSDKEDSASKNITVGFPLYPGCTLLDFAGASQVFGMTPGFEVIWLASTVEPVKTTENVRVLPEYSFDDHPQLDILFMPGGGGEGVTDAMSDLVMQTFIKRIADLETTQWLGSVCTGAFILSAAGLFNGCKATTYWSQLANVALFKELIVQKDRTPGIVLMKIKNASVAVAYHLQLIWHWHSWKK